MSATIKGVGIHNIYGTFVGAREVGYEPETIYEAAVETGDRIYFMFSRREGVKRVSIMRSDAPDDWTNYTFGIASEIHHSVPNGIWIMRLNPGVNPVWLFKASTKVKKGLVYSPTISKANDPKTLAQKEYQRMVEEDKRRGSILMDNPILKEVKGKMTDKSLFHVILFNKKTEEIDFKGYIPARDKQDATMQAAQTYGKYDSKLHLTIAWIIHDSTYTPIS